LFAKTPENLGNIFGKDRGLGILYDKGAVGRNVSKPVPWITEHDK
jgi:hypothetical protein